MMQNQHPVAVERTLMSKLRVFALLIAGCCAFAMLGAFVVKADFGKVTHLGIPDVYVIQAAYDLAAIPENTKHDKDIKGKGNGYRCFLSFINQRDRRVLRRI